MSRDPAGVLFHIPLLTVGGAERNLYDLACELDRKRFEPMVWCSEGTGPIAGELASAGIPVYHHPLDLSDPDRARRTVELLLHIKPVIFHSFSYRRDCSDVLSAVFADVPLIVTVRQNTRHWDPHQTVRDWEQIRNRVTDAVIANTGRLASECMAIERLPAAKIRVIPNGIRIPAGFGRSFTLRRELGLADGALLAGNVGNLKAQKSHDHLLRAWAEVVNRLPNAHLVICGADYGLLPTLEQLRGSLGLDRHVTFLGSRQDMAEIYANLDLYVQSSKAEGMSTAVLEAMSHCLAVVATDAGGTAEAVLDGETGLILAPECPSLLAAAVVRVLEDGGLRERFGQAGRERVVRHFDLSRVVAAHEALYEELLQKAGVN